MPEDKIRSRYERSMRLLVEATRAADRTYVFDNSGCGDERRLCAVIDCDGVRLLVEPPAWVRRFLIEPLVSQAALKIQP